METVIILKSGTVWAKIRFSFGPIILAGKQKGLSPSKLQMPKKSASLYYWVTNRQSNCNIANLSIEQSVFPEFWLFWQVGALRYLWRVGTSVPKLTEDLQIKRILSLVYVWKGLRLLRSRGCRTYLRAANQCCIDSTANTVSLHLCDQTSHMWNLQWFLHLFRHLIAKWLGFWKYWWWKFWIVWTWW